MKSHHSRILRNEASDEYRHFLTKNHRYRTTKKYIFNLKEEVGIKPRRMTPNLWKSEYNRLKRQGKHLVYVSSYILMFYYFNFYRIMFIISNNYCCNLIKGINGLP
jgi:hypothetical protein